jgi:hypothetical protein
MSIGFFAFFEKSFIFLSGLGVPIDVADFACSPAAAVAAPNPIMSAAHTQ